MALSAFEMPFQSFHFPQRCVGVCSVSIFKAALPDTRLRVMPLQRTAFLENNKSIFVHRGLTSVFHLYLRNVDFTEVGIETVSVVVVVLIFKY